MTVALLAKWGDQPPGTLYTTDAATEAAMITAKVATATLAGAITWVPPGNSPDLTVEIYYNPVSKSTVSGDGTILIPVVGGLSTTNSAAAATANTAIIQAALTIGGLVQILAPGVYYTNSTLLIGSNTGLRLGDGVTLRLFGMTNGVNMLQNAALTRSSASVTSITGSLTTLDAVVVQTAHGKVAGDWVWLRGANQTAYIGVFQIITLTDANTYTVRLRRFPSATSATGTLTATTPDVNVVVSGGTWDYNSAQNTTAGDSVSLHCLRFGGMQNFSMPGVTNFGSSLKFNVCVAAVTDYSIGLLRAIQTNSDCLKIYGPAFNGTVDGVSGIVGDDLLSVQPYEADAFSSYRYSFGSVLGLRVGRLNGTKGATALLVFYPDNNHDMDDIEVESVEGTCDASTPVRFQPSNATGNIGRVKVSNVTCPNATNNVRVLSGVTIQSLTLDAINHRPTATTYEGVRMDAGSTIRYLEISGSICNSTIPDATSAMNTLAGTIDEAVFLGGNQYCRGAGVNVLSAAVINSLQVKDWNCNGADYPVRLQGAAAINNVLVLGGADTSPAANARCVVIEGSGIKTATVRNRSLGASMNSAIIVNAGVTNTPTLNVESCNLDGLGTVNVSASCVVNLSNNSITSNSNGVVRTGGTPTVTVRSSGTNRLGAGSFIVVPSGTPVLTLYGWDIAVDPIALTGLATTNGQYILSTQPTIEGGPAVKTAAGWVAMGTGASGVNTVIA